MQSYLRTKQGKGHIKQCPQSAACTSNKSTDSGLWLSQATQATSNKSCHSITVLLPLADVALRLMAILRLMELRLKAWVKMQGLGSRCIPALPFYQGLEHLLGSKEHFYDRAYSTEEYASRLEG